MIFAINYADLKYRKTQQFNSATAIHKGKVDKVISYSPKDMDYAFAKKNREILEQPRGNGYWLWKPYFIHKTLLQMEEGDYLVYLDSGAFYINDVKYLIQQMDRDGQAVMAFELPLKERRYTKRDVFLVMDCDKPEYFETNQRMATMIILKKTNVAMRFVQEWLGYCQCGHIITDEKNNMGKGNYKGFVDNRHDQSIFSLLSKKYGFKAYRDPSQFGRFPDVFWPIRIDEIQDYSKYPQIITKHGRGEVTKHIFWEQMMFAYAPKIILRLYRLSNLWQRTGKEQSIAVLTDNMPIKEDAYGFGMYKVVNRLLQALGEKVEYIIITDRRYDSKNLEGVFRNRAMAANRFHHVPITVLSDIVFLYEIYKSMHELKQKKIRKLFIPLGADYAELRRAYLVSKIYRMAVSIYVVDDFVEYQNRIIGNERKRIEKKVIKYLRGVNKIFVISDGMKNRIDALTGKKSIILPIPYEKQLPDIPHGCRKNQILFLGSINMLYRDGLRDIAEVIDKINRMEGSDIKLRFTYKTAAEVQCIIGKHRCIISQRIEGEDELMEELRTSLFCCMPYSDDIDLYVMQNTSFPSKLVEYLAAASSIVIYGNKRNSAQLYFEKNNLPYVICGKNKKLLEDCIIRHLEQEPDYSSEYRKALETNHSFDKVGKRIRWYI